MAQRIYNLSKWTHIPEGTVLPFPGSGKRRTVVLETNCEGPVCLYAIQDLEDVLKNPERQIDLEAGRRVMDASVTTRFIAYLRPGRDTVEFSVDGPFELLVEGGPVHVYSQDGQSTAVRIVAAEVFTRIANRRQRNPQLELMMWQQRQNMERRFADLAAETERRIVAAEKGAKERYVKQRDSRPPDRGFKPAAGPEGAFAASARSDVREAGPDTEQGRNGTPVAVAERVSEAAKQPRRKDEKTS